MRCRQRHELRKAHHPPQWRALMVGGCERVEFMSRNQLQELAEHCAMMSQGLVPRLVSMVCRNSIVPPDERTRPLLLHILWDSSDSDPENLRIPPHGGPTV